MAAKGIQLHGRWDCGMILTKSDGTWGMSANMPRWKKITYHAIMYGMVALFPLVLIFGYLGARKLTHSYEYCGSYGRIDDRLGWVLAPNQSSCLSLQNRLRGTTYFASTIFTNDEGLRSSASDSQTQLNAFVAVGDS